MTHKTILILILAMVATGWLISVGIAEPREEGRSERERDRILAQREEREQDEREARERERMIPRRRERETRGRELPREAWNPEMIKLHQMLRMLEAIGDTAFNSERAALIGIGSINDEFDLSPQQAAEKLETILKSTRTLGLRNAIRLTLKDIYRKIGQKEKGLEHMRAMIAENDEYLQGQTCNETKEQKE